MKHIIIITAERYPNGGAGAVRLHYIAKALLEAGCQVSVLCRGHAGETGCFDNVPYYSLRGKCTFWGARVLDYFLFSARVKQWLKSSQKDIDCIYAYGVPVSLLRFLKKWNRHGIQLLYDCVEWYSPQEFKLKRFDWRYQANNYINSKLIDGSFSVIAISCYLKEYYSKKNIAVLRVPVLCECTSRKKQKAGENSLTLFYAGVPGKKDYIGNILEASLLLKPEEQKKIKIVFVGIRRSALEKQLGISPKILAACTEFLELYDRVPREDVLKKMKSADFVVLPRDASLRYAQAGFPSKVVESLVNATPVLCNYSSDLELYLTDGENALIADDHTPEALAVTLRRALCLTAAEKERMSENALRTAERFFDYRLYVEPLQEFINGDG